MYGRSVHLLKLICIHYIQVILAEKRKHEEERAREESIISLSESEDSDEDVYISECKKAALRRREENRELMKKLQIYKVSALACVY